MAVISDISGPPHPHKVPVRLNESNLRVFLKEIEEFSDISGPPHPHKVINRIATTTPPPNRTASMVKFIKFTWKIT